jgi:Transposase, Mutator family
LSVIRWGKQQNKQRFKCKNCGILFTQNDRQQVLNNRFVWFRKWVLERQTFKTLQRDSGLSKDTLQRLFYHFLAKAPITPIIHHDMVHLRVDATYFKRFCVVCYQDDLLSYTQLFRFSDAERYEEIKEDLQNLLKLGLQIESITSDGHKATLKAIKKVMPNVLVQRCLVHIQRMCLLWLTSNPTYPAGKELRELAVYIHRIQTHNDKYYWINQLKQWEARHKNFLKEKSYKIETGRYWYKHKLIRRAFLTIKRALPNMFWYLDNENVPKTTNGIESYFGHLKNHLDLHRGLTKEHRISFIKWYIYFRNKSNL